MARSFRKVPIFTNCLSTGSQKIWKRQKSKQRRAAERNPRFLEAGVTRFDKSNNPWDSPGDGWSYFGDASPKMMRK